MMVAVVMLVVMIVGAFAVMVAVGVSVMKGDSAVEYLKRRSGR
jgi:hypothetical protein